MTLWKRGAVSKIREEIEGDKRKTNMRLDQVASSQSQVLPWYQSAYSLVLCFGGVVFERRSCERIVREGHDEKGEDLRRVGSACCESDQRQNQLSGSWKGRGSRPTDYTKETLGR